MTAASPGRGDQRLDLAAIEELERALKAFDGALAIVSHDQAFLRNIGIAREIVI